MTYYSLNIKQHYFLTHSIRYKINIYYPPRPPLHKIYPHKYYGGNLSKAKNKTKMESKEINVSQSMLSFVIYL